VSPVASVTTRSGSGRVDKARVVCGVQVARSACAAGRTAGGDGDEVESAWSVQVLGHRGTVWLQAAYERDPGGVVLAGTDP